jgi:CHAD domain-containing protein
MMSPKYTDPVKNPSFGLSYWMEQVLAEVDKAHRDLDPDRIHDLRVALRRCRSMAEGFMAIDPDKKWRAMLKQGRQLFRQLGRLRDVQVLEEWIGRLGEPEDIVSAVMLAHLAQSERKLKHTAIHALQAFNRDKWRELLSRLQGRARHLPPGDTVFQLSALQAWNEAHALHKHALRNRSDAAYHRLRIAIKKFRYTVENFLPLLHDAWGQDLKEMQDCLGEAHDLFVFWQTALRFRVFPDMESRERWRTRISIEKTTRIDHYRTHMVGRHSLWGVWRLALPPQNHLPSATLKMIEKWAFFKGIHLTRVHHVRRLAMQMFHGLRSGNHSDIKTERDIVHLAAILQELERTKNGKGFGLDAAGLRLELPSTQGFTGESLAIAAMVVRGQRGKHRGFDWEKYPALSGEQRQLIMELCGILRLARVLSGDSTQTIQSLKVEQTGNSIIIFAAGYSELGPLAEKVARARYLLEYACQKPVIIRGAPDNPDPGNS